jgi:Immunity protein 17
MNPAGLLVIAIGLFSLCCAGFGWEWFMNHHKTRFVAAILGRTGARVFYGLLGFGLVVVGALLTLGIIHDVR